jgi:hypothetical protein
MGQVLTSIQKEALVTDMWLQRIVGLFAATLFAVSCAGNEDGKGENDDWLGSNSNPNYCADMPGDELAKVAIDQPEQGRWTLRYPVARGGCGAYHLSATFDFAPQNSDEPTYTYEVDVCNQCEEPRTWNYLSDISGVSVDAPPKSLSVPDPKVVKDAPLLNPQGLPVVYHSAAGQKPSWEIACKVECDPIVPSIDYGEISQVLVPSDEVKNSAAYGADFQDAARAILDTHSRQADASSVILWPKLHRADTAITGLYAASQLEHCAAQKQVPCGGCGVNRCYDRPYDVQKKYVRQTTELPELPQEFVDKLRQHVDGSDN